MSLALAISPGCDEGAGSADTPGARIQIDVGALELPGITDASYTLSVVTGTEVVWTRTVSSSAFGDSQGGLTYVGPCDAQAAQNTVELTLNSLEVSGIALTDGVDYTNPAPAGSPLSQAATCNADSDTPVTFNLVLARAANQGFFDIAVTFEDIFCSAKLDCQDGGGPLTQLHDPHTGERAQTAIMAFACTAGSDATQTVLHMNDVTISCGNGAMSTTIAVDGGPGNLNPDFPGPPNAADLLFQAAVYRGAEDLGGLNKGYLHPPV